MIYPHKYHIPIALDQDVKSVSTRIPVGLLKLTVVSANGLKPVEFMSSDPFVQLSVCGVEHKTPVVKNSIAPVWSAPPPPPLLPLTLCSSDDATEGMKLSI
jgi:Ca2+-dependent lipid-binding protein